MKKKLLVALVPLVMLSACGSNPPKTAMDSSSLFGKGAKTGDSVRIQIGTWKNQKMMLCIPYQVNILLTYNSRLTKRCYRQSVS